MKSKHKILVVEAISEAGEIKKVNQDHILARVGEIDGQQFGLFAVADGMGGLEAGGYASSFTIKKINQWWEGSLPGLLVEYEEPIDIMVTNLEELVREINHEILSISKEINKKMGTTLSILLLYKENYYIFHIGDCRIHKIYNLTINQLTEDHSYVGDLVKKGTISIEEAKCHPKRNLITRCLGVTSKIELFYHWGKQRLGENFLISSDGFYNQLEDAEIVLMINKYKYNVKKALKELTRLVYERGAHDNLSVIYVGGKTEASIFQRIRSSIEN
ncbi:PP2C family protein-serine/threonine phosphatase [Alkaliphilus transvaalensis]|uniref:PP2C family protein-serine/threonine phosphatase n=1 Tax=Alkaliphilus transvaalensis TaxID=114628 RepID=UPI0006841314|nr:protein phosphatase 2C domain-containing protein [Alkaliphilus transvaalensis]